jgi:hypothetical protein
VTPTVTVETPTANWREALPEDIRANKTFEKFDGVPALAKSYASLEQAYSKKIEGLVKVPGSDAKPDEVAAYRAAIGVPQIPDQYTLDVAESLRPILPLESLAPFKQIFHQLGIPGAQAQQLVTAYAENLQRQIVEVGKQNAAALDKIKNEIGPVTFDRDWKLAEKAIEKLVDEDGIAFLNRPGIAGHPFFFKLFSNLGRQMEQSGDIEADMTGIASKEVKSQRLKDILNNKEWLNGKHPQQAQWQAEFNQLTKELTPEPR